MEVTQNNFSPRQLKEIRHNKKILGRADKVWGRKGLIGKARVARRAAMFIEMAGLREGKSVLEIGCGTGELTYYLARSGASIVATDIFEEFLEVARSKVNFPNVKFQCARGESLDNFQPDFFDLVCGASVLHHLDIGPALKNIKRVLKPGDGLMVFSEPNMLNPQIFFQKNIPFLKKWLGDSPQETAFFRWQMKDLLKKARFEDISVQPFDFTHPALPDFLAGPAKNIGYFLEKTPLLKEFAGSLLIVARRSRQ